MSVIVKGMEMPYGCADCDFCGGIIMPDGIYCCDCPTEASHGKNISDAINNDARADFCPLVEIPTPHGRLVDVDDFMRHLISNVADLRTLSTGTVGKALHETPTIVEAEGREE